MSEEQQSFEGLCRTVQALSSSIDDRTTWGDIKNRCNDLTQSEKSDAFLTAIFSYHYGRDQHNEDPHNEQVTGDATKIMGVRVPDLEQRLPWYAAMFEIIDKGVFQGGVLGHHYFRVGEETARKLADYLSGQTKIKPEKALQAVAWLERELGELPGVFYAPRSGAVQQELRSSRFKQIYLICQYLHSPMQRLNGKTAADFHYDGLTKLGYAKHPSRPAISRN